VVERLGWKGVPERNLLEQVPLADPFGAVYVVVLIRRARFSLISRHTAKLAVWRGRAR